MNLGLLLGAATAAIACTVSSAHADVWIPEDGYVGFYDRAGVYQVAGIVKNSEPHPVIPTIMISVLDGEDLISGHFEYVSVAPGGELPFKFALPEVDGEDPILHGVDATFIRGMQDDRRVGVVYDDSLVLHPDGSMTGRVANAGDEAASGFRVLAVIHGKDHAVLDVGENDAPLGEIAPGEILEFTMRPDPSIAGDVAYYSCFAIGDISVIALNAQRHGENFKIRYDSPILLSYPEFDDTGEVLSLWLNPGWPMQTSLNLEFPMYARGESFDVALDGEPIDSIQSVGETGNWHVAFSIEDQASGMLTIRGFDPERTAEAAVPDRVRTAAGWWSQQRISEAEFASELALLVTRGMMEAPTPDPSEVPRVPDWVRTVAGWWSQQRISDAEFVSGLEHLALAGVVTVGAPQADYPAPPDAT